LFRSFPVKVHSARQVIFANLAHMALVLIGEGKANIGGSVLSGAKALRRRGLQPVTVDRQRRSSVD